MEEVEVANMAAVESCHRVLALLSQQQDFGGWTYDPFGALDVVLAGGMP